MTILSFAPASEIAVPKIFLCASVHAANAKISACSLLVIIKPYQSLSSAVIFAIVVAKSSVEVPAFIVKLSETFIAKSSPLFGLIFKIPEESKTVFMTASVSEEIIA